MSSPNTPADTSDRGVLILLGWLAAAGVIGFLISPAITWTLTQLPIVALPIVGELQPAEYVARKGHVSVFGRTVMITALVGLVLLRRSIGFGWQRLDQLGLIGHGVGGPGLSLRALSPRSLGTDVAVGFVLATLGLAAAIALKLAVGEAVWELDEKLVRRVLSSLTAALLVSAIEEPLFRGLIQNGLVGRLGTGLGIAATNVIFSGSHCLSAAKPGKDGAGVVLVDGPVDFAASAQCLLAFANSWSSDPAGTAIKFVSLLLFGLMLSWSVRARGGLVYLAIGLHAGTVFVLQADGAVTSPNEQFDLAGWRLILGGKHMESALIGWGVMLSVTAMVWGWIRLCPTAEPTVPTEEGLDSNRCETV